jgi:hypothetical protein
LVVQAGRERALVSRNSENKQNINEVLDKVAKALEGLEFGEVVIKVQGGKVIFVDRYERERVG